MSIKKANVILLSYFSFAIFITISLFCYGKTPFDLYQELKEEVVSPTYSEQNNIIDLLEQGKSMFSISFAHMAKDKLNTRLKWEGNVTNVGYWGFGRYSISVTKRIPYTTEYNRVHYREYSATAIFHRQEDVAFLSKEQLVSFDCRIDELGIYYLKLEDCSRLLE